MAWEERDVASWGGEGTEIGDKVEGTLVRTEPNVNAKEDDKNPLFDYIVKTKEHPELRIWGSRFLNLQLTERDVGKEVQVEFAGLAKATQKGKNPAKQFRVKVKK